MPKFVIEREIPGAGGLSPEELRGISQTSCGVLQQMGPRIQWLHSYVAGDKIYTIVEGRGIQESSPFSELPAQP